MKHTFFKYPLINLVALIISTVACALSIYNNNYGPAIVTGILALINAFILLTAKKY